MGAIMIWPLSLLSRPSINGKIKPRQANGRAAVPHGKVSSGPLASAAVAEPKSIGKMVELVEKDYMFLLAYLVLKSSIESAEATIEASGDPRGTVLARNLERVWRESLSHMLRCIAFGRSAFERWYVYDRASGLQLVGGLDYLDFEYTAMRLGNDGEFEGIDLTVKGRTETLEPDRAWWLALDPTAKHPHGRSRYLGAPLEVWKVRQSLDQNEKKWHDRFALGLGLAKAPSEYAADGTVGKGNIGELNQDGTPANPISDMRRALLDLASGGYAVVPSENNPDGSPGWSVDHPSTKQDAGPIENQRKRLDAAALRSMGIPERAVTQDDATGSYAMAEVHWRVLGSTCEGILSQIVASFQQYVIDKAVQINFSGGTKLTMTTQPINDLTRPLVIDLVKAAVASPQLSPLLAQGVIDLPKMLELSGLPTGTDIAAALKKIAETPPAPSPSGFGMARRLARTDGIPETENWEAYADDAYSQARSLIKRIRSMPQGSVDRGLLRRPLETISVDPCESDVGGEAGRDAHSLAAGDSADTAAIQT